MKNFILGIVCAYALLVILIKIAAPLLAQENRLVVHTEFGRLQAICDTGNGAMIYFGTTGSVQGGVGVAVLPNGCNTK